MMDGSTLHRLRLGGIDVAGYDRSEATAGVTGSLLSISPAAGVVMLGQASGVYSFFNGHNWNPRVELVYGASITVHMALNHALFR